MCEEIGRLPEETNQEFVNSLSFYRILVTTPFRRLRILSVADYIKVMTEISRGCPESGSR